MTIGMMMNRFVGRVVFGLEVDGTRPVKIRSLEKIERTIDSLPGGFANAPT